MWVDLLLAYAKKMLLMIICATAEAAQHFFCSLCSIISLVSKSKAIFSSDEAHFNENKLEIMSFQQGIREQRCPYSLGWSFYGSVEIQSAFKETFAYLYPPAKCVCWRVYCFHVVRPNERTKVCVIFCFLNILKSH